MRQTVKVGVVVVAVAVLATAGVALAVDDGADDGTLGRAAGRIVEMLDPLVADGTIDEGQARAVGEHLAGAVPLHPRLGPGTEEPGVFGRGPLCGLGVGRLAMTADLADFLGMSVDEMRDALAGGATLEEIAADRGVAVDDLVAFLLEPVAERLDAAVEADRITQERADDLLAAAEERIRTAVGEVLPVLGSGGFGERRFGPGDSGERPFGPGRGFHHPWHGAHEAPEGADTSA